MGLDVYDGPNASRVLLDADRVIASPSIPPQNSLWRAMADRSLRVTTTMDLWMEEFGRRTVGITGSKGKSTTTTLVARLMQSAGVDVAVGGNLGIPVFDLSPTASHFVVEVSSFQAARLRTSPRIAVVTALFPEHLDWHGGFEAYADAKWNLTRHGCEGIVTSRQVLERVPSSSLGARLIVPLTDTDWPEELGPDLKDVWPSHDEGPWRLHHNRMNAVLAVTASWLALNGALTGHQARAALIDYRGLPHRMENVASFGGRVWIDDVLATSPDPTLNALATLCGDPVCLIVGGKDRGLDYSNLVRTLASRTAPTIVVCLPEVGALIGSQLLAERESPLVLMASSVPEAVRLAYQASSPGYTVLFSPAAPSSEAQGNFKQRSSDFVESIKDLEK